MLKNKFEQKYISSGNYKTLSSDFTSRGIKEVIRMNDEAIRELFCTFVEEGKLDEEIAEQMLQQILEILFGEKSDTTINQKG